MDVSSIRILIVIVVIFVLSLIGATVLFKYLKSSALIKKEGYKAGGAIAGFLLLFWALFYAFDRLSAEQATARPMHWTIVGTVHKAGAKKHDGITVRQIPPRPLTATNPGGGFRLENVVTRKGETLPEILLESPGYSPQTFTITEQNATVDSSREEITLRVPVEIPELPVEEPSTGGQER